MFFVSTSLWHLVSQCRYLSCDAEHRSETPAIHTWPWHYLQKQLVLVFPFPHLTLTPWIVLYPAQKDIFIRLVYSDSLRWTVLHNYFSVSHGIMLPKPLCGFSYAFAGFSGCSTTQQGGKYWMGIKTQPLLLQRVIQATLYNVDAQQSTWGIATVWVVFVNRDQIMGVTSWQSSNRLLQAVYSAVPRQQLHTWSEFFQYLSCGIFNLSYFATVWEKQILKKAGFMSDAALQTDWETSCTVWHCGWRFCYFKLYSYFPVI